MDILRYIILIAIVAGAFFVFSLYSSKNKNEDNDKDDKPKGWGCH